jgi:hypothetical protein
MSEYTESAARFARESAGHQMTTLHEDGLYRHLAFANPDGGFYRFDLVTWPHNLMLRGDGFSFAFSVYPTADMFDLFKGSSHGGINPGYWQEKVTAGRGDIKAWSEDLFRTWLVEEAAAHEAQFPGAVEAVGEQILHSDEHSLDYRGTAEYAVASFRHGDFRLRIPEEWEQSFQDYSWEFLFACHAIVWGIGQYDAARKAVTA